MLRGSLGPTWGGGSSSGVAGSARPAGESTQGKQLGRQTGWEVAHRPRGKRAGPRRAPGRRPMGAAHTQATPPDPSGAHGLGGADPTRDARAV